MPSPSGTERHPSRPGSSKFTAPPVWSGRAIRLHLLVLVIAVVAGFGLVVGTSGSTAGRIAALSAAIAFVAAYSALWLALVRRSSGDLVTIDRGREVEIPGSRAMASLLLLALLAVTAFPVIFAIGVFRDGLAPGSTAMFTLSMLVGLLCLPIVITVALGRFRMNRLILTADTVTYEAYRGQTSLPWADIDSVAITSEPKAQIVLSSPSAELRIPIGLMASGPVPLAEYLLDHMVHHPARRTPGRPTHGPTAP